MKLEALNDLLDFAGATEIGRLIGFLERLHARVRALRPGAMARLTVDQLFA